MKHADREDVQQSVVYEVYDPGKHGPAAPPPCPGFYHDRGGRWNAKVGMHKPGRTMPSNRGVTIYEFFAEADRYHMRRHQRGECG